MPKRPLRLAVRRRLGNRRSVGPDFHRQVGNAPATIVTLFCVLSVSAMLAALPMAAGAPDGTPAFAEDFASTRLVSPWRVRQGRWTVADGVLSGRKDPASVHPAKLELFVPQRDGEMQFSFKTDQPGGIDFYFYQGAVRIAVLQLRSEGLAFATFPKTGPSEPTYLARTATGLAHASRHTATIERRAGTVLVRIDTGSQLRIEHTGLEEETSSFLFILRGPLETTLAVDDIKVWRSP